MTSTIEPTAATERHYTAKEIAEMWKVHPDTVRHMFSEEPGVLKFSMPRLLKRSRVRTSLRIPASVLERVHQQRVAPPFSAAARRRHI